MPNVCSWASIKSYFCHTNHMLGTLDLTGSESKGLSLQFLLEHILVNGHNNIIIYEKNAQQLHPMLRNLDLGNFA